MKYGRGAAPILLGNKDEAELQMRLSIVRLESNRSATFLGGGIEIADAVQRLSELEPMTCVIRINADSTARFPECGGRVGLLEDGAIRRMLITNSFKWRRRTL